MVSAKIKATGSCSLLKDEEYVALVGNHLPRDIMWRWIESKKTGYIFLGSSSRTAKEILTNEFINAALSTESEKQKCSSCNKLHSGSAVRPRLQLPSKEVAKPVFPAARKLTNTETNLELKELQRGSKIVPSSKHQWRIRSKR